MQESGAAAAGAVVAGSFEHTTHSWLLGAWCMGGVSARQVLGATLPSGGHVQHGQGG